MKNKCPFYIVFQVLKKLLIKIYKIKPPPVIFFVCFTLASTSADIIFHNILEHNSPLTEERFLSQIFLFKPKPADLLSCTLFHLYMKYTCTK